MQEKALRFLIRIHAMPVSWASRFPAGFAPAPARPHASFCVSRPCQSPICYPALSHQVHQPVGIIVAFLCGPRRSRCRTGWVTSPRIIIAALWHMGAASHPLISLDGQKLGRLGICPARFPVCSCGWKPPHRARGTGAGVALSRRWQKQGLDLVAVVILAGLIDAVLNHVQAAFDFLTQNVGNDVRRQRLKLAGSPGPAL